MKDKLFKSLVFTILLIANVGYPQMQLDWARRHNGPDQDRGSGICVDDSGNVYVTGTVQSQVSTFICTTIKYSNSGDSLWVRQYQRPGTNFNVGRDIAIDKFGNVYVANSESIIKYNMFGDLQWAIFDSLEYLKISLDEFGNIYTSGFGHGLVTMKYDTNGNVVWKQTYNAYKLNDMCIDKFGNVIITGEVWYAESYYDYITIKYSNNGDFRWARSYNGPGPQPSNDLAYAVATDTSANVYVTGASEDPNSVFNCVTIKYDSSGNVKWVKRIYPPANAYDIAVDEFQNSYITSRSNGYNYTTKLDLSGNVLWSRTYPTSNGFAINPSVIILDSVNNVYVTSNSDSISNTSYAAIKYDSNGNRIFLVAYGFHPVGFDYVYDMAIDRKGRVYLTGQSNFAFATVKFSEIFSNISGNNIIATDYYLQQNYPNPFNPSSTIFYSLLKSGLTKIIVYNITGKEVAILVDEFKQAGGYEVIFNAEGMPSGIYFYKIEAGNFIQTRKMLLIK